MARADAALTVALATLPPDDRATVASWLTALGFEAEELHACPPLRQLVSMMAVLRLVADMDEALDREERFREAAGALGLNGASLLRSWYRWQDAAARQFVRDDDAAA